MNPALLRPEDLRYGRLWPLSRLSMNSLRSAWTAVLAGLPDPMIRAKASCEGACPATGKSRETILTQNRALPFLSQNRRNHSLSLASCRSERHCPGHPCSTQAESVCCHPLLSQAIRTLDLANGHTSIVTDVDSALGYLEGATPTPEPFSTLLAGIGIAAVIVCGLRKRLSF
jgi:hypothetical protein